MLCCCGCVRESEWPALKPNQKIHFIVDFHSRHNNTTLLLFFNTLPFQQQCLALALEVVQRGVNVVWNGAWNATFAE